MNEMVQRHVETILRYLIDAKALDQLPTADGIFVFGCIDARVAIHAANLFTLGKAPTIIVSGKGKSGKLPRGFDSEMEYFFALFLECGVPQSVFIGDGRASNTLENVLLGMEEAVLAGFNPRSLILCAKPPLLRRAGATFQRHFPEITTHGSTYSFSDKEWLSDERWIQRILGEVIRLERYAENGDIAPCSIPPEAREAFEAVLALYPDTI